MIYLDNSATTLRKPPEVAEAVSRALQTFGNPGRSFHSPAMLAARAVAAARSEVAKLVGLQNPLHVAFTSGATESLNLVIDSLICEKDDVITTVLEHNSVLRPLYKTGCSLQFIGCDVAGKLILDDLSRLLRPHTRFLVCAHGSNLLGSVADVTFLWAFCKEHGLVFILDVAQTMGAVPVSADMADVLCFTGHKALFGPQGTGGIIADGMLPHKLVKTGGTGAQSFAHSQPLHMPDLFEAGTPNAHALAGLQKGAEHIGRIGLAAIMRHDAALVEAFMQQLADIPGLKIYGPGAEDKNQRLPIVALNIGDMPADEVALRLWEEWAIATRPGSHCAPLAHRHFATKQQGMVRFSFSWYNTLEEVSIAANALRAIAAGV